MKEMYAPKVPDRAGMKVVPAGEKECIWMQADQVKYKLCTNDYACTSCQFDDAMTNRVQKDRVDTATVKDTRKKELVEWDKKFRELPADQRKCRYMITDQVSYKLCPSAFQCGDCSYDQMMQDRLPPVTPSKNLETVAGFKQATDVYFSRGHTWAKPEYGGKIRVGIDDFGKRLVASIKDMKLPKVGDQITQNGVAAKLGAGKEDIDLMSPITGTVTAVNPKVKSLEDMTDPYGEDWMFIVEPEGNLKKNLKGLLFDQEAKAWLEDESNRLVGKLESEGVGPTMHDGGFAVDDIKKYVGEETWTGLVDEFLLSKK